MSDRNDFNNKEPREQKNLWFYLTLIAAIFVFASWMMPSLVSLFFVSFILCIAYMIYSNVDAGASQVRSRASNKLNGRLGSEKYIQSALVDALQFPAFILDVEGKIMHSNASSKKAFGVFSYKEKIFIQFRQPELRQLIERGLASENALKGEYNEPVPNDRSFAVEISPIPNKSNNKTSPLFLLGFHDLTKAKRTDQMRSDFIANASHELRTPLASLLGYIETIKGPARNDEKAIDRFTDIMMDQAQRMTRLVNDLLSLSRIEMKSHVRPSKVVDLSEVILNVINPLQSLAKRLDVEIEFANPGETYIIADRDELLQVFQNLIENACKYGQEGKKVMVSIERDDVNLQATASVRDFGPGIAIEHQHRITERFYRVDVARSREKQGTGLGLAIVKHILNRHAVKLNIESSVGNGTRFFIKFPIHKN